MNKQDFGERDICTKFINPAVKQAGWDEMSQFREKVGFTKGHIIIRGKLVSRGKGKRADYILYFKPNVPIAIFEAKDNTQASATEYSRPLKTPSPCTSPLFSFSIVTGSSFGPNRHSG
jgi:type I restriction enzyme R subunit